MSTSLRDHLQTSLGSAYALDRELGGGGMSRVFVATETALGRNVVIKVLPPELSAGVSVERFRREIQLAARLQHAHIVPLLAAGETNGLPWFSMPFVEGESLRARLAQPVQLSTTEARRVLRDIASALAYAHAHGVVHRDLKPENILLSDGGALVTDFGIAKAISAASGNANHPDGDTPGDPSTNALTSVGLSLGTPAYMAPEQVAADPLVDHRADVYAWGVVAYELLAGRSPFAGRSMQAILAAHLAEPPEPLERVRPDVPPAIATLVMRCLAKAPADRPQTARELVDALDALATPGGTNPGVIAGGMTLGASASAPGLSRPRRIILATVSMLVVIGAASTWIAVSRRSVGRLEGSPRSATRTRRVAIAPFQNLTGDSTLAQVGRVAADWLSQGIAQADSADVVSPMEVGLVLAGATADADVVRRLADATGAGLVVTGSVVRRRDSLVVRARAVDATGRTRFTFDEATGPASDPIAVIDAMREQVLGALAVEGDRARYPVRPPRFSAYQEYVAGAERYFRFRDFVGARLLLQRAVALDSTFVLAQYLLSYTYSQLNQWDSVAMIGARFERLAPRIPPSERLFLEDMRARLNSDYAVRLRVQQQLAARDSVPNNLYLVGFLAVQLRRPDVAIPALEASDSVLVAAGWANQAIMLSEAYLQAGRFDDAIRYLTSARQRLPNDATLAGQLVRIYAAGRRSREAIALADSLLAIANDAGGADAYRLVLASHELSARGDTAVANQLARSAVLWYTSHPVAAPSSQRLYREAVAYWSVGDEKRATLRFSSATRTVTDTASIDATGFLGVAAALHGDTARAKVIADSLGGLAQKWMFGANTYWRGAIYGALGERDHAVQLLRQAMSERKSARYWHATPELAPLRGFAPFNALITPAP